MLGATATVAVDGVIDRQQRNGENVRQPNWDIPRDRSESEGLCMILKRTPRMGAPGTLAAIALIVLAAAHHRAYAQAKAEERNSTAKITEDKTRTGTAAERDETKTRLGTRPRKGPAIPEPTVVLHPGEVPIIKLDSPVFDFGRVRAGTPVQHDFVFTNAGNGALEILKAKAG